MKLARRIFTSIMTLIVLLVASAVAFAATDNFYQPVPVVPVFIWDGTDASRLKDSSPPAYDFIYGDDTTLTYNLPWTFYYYGQPYTKFFVDTNGNIWFANSTSASSFDLTNTGKGPVIAAWNNDLSSQYYGGVFIQRKLTPDRVVIEWKTETFSEEGTSSINSFETVLFPNGDIRIDNKSFSTQNGMGSGSGISKGDGTAYSSTATLPNTSFQFKKQPLLLVSKAGSGAGTVTSIPTGTSCGNACNIPFTPGTLVTLTATPDADSTFVGWSGACTGTGTCQVTVNDNKAVTMSTNTTVTANFKKNYSLNLVISGTGAGIVTSVPPKMACNTSCSDIYVSGDQVTLVPTPYEYSYFSGWSNGACVGTGNCTLIMNANTTVTSNFNKDIQHQVRIDIGSTPSYFSTIQSAFDAAPTDATIKLWGTLFTENVIFSGAKAIDLQGGYNAAFTAVSGRSIINGRLTINSGSKLNVNNLTIEPAAP